MKTNQQRSRRRVLTSSALKMFSLLILLSCSQNALAQQQNLTRTLPLVVNNEVDIGSFAFSNGGGSLWISVTVPSGGYSVAKEYLLPIQYNQNINIWQTVLPASSTSGYSGNDFALDLKINGATASLRLRTIASDGVSVGTAYVSIKQEGVTGDTFTPSTSTSAASAPTTSFTSTALTQVGGNVGIGTTSPGGKLDVQRGDGSDLLVRAWNSATGSGAAIFRAAASSGGNEAARLELTDNTGYNGGISGDHTYGLTFRTGNQSSSYSAMGARMTITPAGYVGIGTTGPTEFVHVRKDQNAATHLVVENTTAGASAYADLQVKNDLGNFAQFGLYSSTTSTAGALASGNAFTYTTSPAMVIMTNNAGGVIKFATGGISERARIDASGNFGIGTAAPGFKLDVQGGSLNSSGGLCIAGDCKTAWSQVGGSQWTTSGSNIYYSSGNVGIGTASPGAKLAATASTATNATFIVTPDGTNNYYAGNNHDALLVDGSLTATHGTYTSGTVRLFRIRSMTGADSLIVGRGGDVVVTPNTNYAAAGLRLFPDASNSYYAGSDYDVLQIGGNGLNSHGSYTGKTVRLIHVTNATGGDAFVIARDGNATFGGNVTVTGNINAKYQDVAEWVQSSQALSAGTVVVLDQTKSNQVIASFQAYDTRVAGVVSSQPGIALGENGAGKVLVATTGRVKVKVDATAGPIHVGDLLVTSDKEGVAQKSEPLSLGGVQIHRPGTLIGKALEPLEKGTSEILVLLSLQ